MRVAIFSANFAWPSFIPDARPDPRSTLASARRAAAAPFFFFCAPHRIDGGGGGGGAIGVWPAMKSTGRRFDFAVESVATSSSNRGRASRRPETHLCRNDLHIVAVSLSLSLSLSGRRKWGRRPPPSPHSPRAKITFSTPFHRPGSRRPLNRVEIRWPAVNTTTTKKSPSTVAGPTL